MTRHRGTSGAADPRWQPHVPAAIGRRHALKLCCSSAVTRARALAAARYERVLHYETAGRGRA